MMSSADQLQRLAADPQSCVWVAASAGTGKTKVLTDRVLNLLLEGAQPQRILCLTFTKAAAGEMQNRLHQRLSEWVSCSDEMLREKLREFMGQAPTEQQMNRARTLFPLVLDSPGGMKIQTIHGFCQSILKRFPLEAKLTPHFQVLDETLSDHLLKKVQNDLLRVDRALKPYLAKLTDIFDDQRFSEMLTYLMAERHKWSWLIGQSPDSAETEIEKILNVSLKADNSVHEAFNQRYFQREKLLQASDWLQIGSEADQQRGASLKQFLLSENFEGYSSVFLTTDGEIRKRFATKKVIDSYPDITDILIREAERILLLKDRINSHDCAIRSLAVIRLGVAILKKYTEEKEKRGQLDYNDLIERTSQLLKLPDVAPWVLYKLDGGLDHMLVDEAQDTNLYQWTVISALAEEFFSGTGAREQQRTLFVVGDAKQSIYSFQGANPYVFDGMRQYFTSTVKAAKANWREVQLNISFRSTQAVLAVVDQVFTNLVARNGVAIQEELIEHHSFRKGQGGTVEVWPLVEPDEVAEMTPWAPPVMVENQDVAPQVRLATVIACQIKEWLDTKEILPAKGRPVRAGDILVLVRRRSSFVEDLVRALKKNGVPVAGADRMDLLNHLAVQDLMALGRFVIQPLDDLNLACVLKGPLINLNEEDLFELAYDRSGQSLWSAILNRNRELADRLNVFIELAQTTTPFDFYSMVLTKLGGRKAILARIGFEAVDAIDEFLNVVQNYQSNHIPSLLGLLSWLAEGDLEVKRDLDQSNLDEVRIMTVHGSKGLQAPIVFLPDTTQLPRNMDRVLWADTDQNRLIPVLAPLSQKGCKATDELKQQTQQLIEQEYRRLMYVAMTRAEDRLYVCGWKNQKEVNDISWYNLILDAVKNLGQEVIFDFTKISPQGWQDMGYRYTCPQLVERNLQEIAGSADTKITQPEWLNKKPVVEGVQQKKIRPSSAADAKFVSSQCERGTVIHKLLQYLPEVPEAIRYEAGMQLLKTVQNYPVEFHSGLVQDVTNVINDDKLKHLFAQGSRCEVPVTGTVQDKLVSGQIDRLIVRDHEVIIIDYKTNRVPPTNVQEVPTVYLHQLFTYKEILQRIYPHHTIRCILLWTQTLDIMEITV